MIDYLHTTTKNGSHAFTGEPCTNVQGTAVLRDGDTTAHVNIEKNQPTIADGLLHDVYAMRAADIHNNNCIESISHKHAVARTEVAGLYTRTCAAMIELQRRINKAANS